MGSLEFASQLGNWTQLPCLNECLTVYLFTDRQTNQSVDMMLYKGWCILATWIESGNMCRDEEGCLSGISFRFGKEKMRVTMTADLYIPVYTEGIVNIDSDEPGSEIRITPTQANELWKLKAASIAGYGPCGSPGVGLQKPMKTPALLIVGLDIEVTTFDRNGSMPLPHDPIVSIAITNGGWYTKSHPDVCMCIYTNGYHGELKNEEGRQTLTVKANSSAHAVMLAYKFLDAVNADFVTIHNGFNFDVRHMACACAEIDGLSDTFEERRLGNVGFGVFWRLTNGTMCVDTMYYVDKNTRSDWSSLSLARMAERFDLPPKLDPKTMSLDTRVSNDMTQMIVYNCRDSDLHVWVAESLDMCARICTLAGASRSTLWDSVANNTGVMTFCMIQSVCMSLHLHLDLSRSTGTDEKSLEGGYVLEPVPGCYRGVIVIDGNSLYGSIMSSLGVFTDRCASSSTVEGLCSKMRVNTPPGLNLMEIGHIVWNEEMIGMRTPHEYLGVVRGGATVLTLIIKELMNSRSKARKDGDVIVASCYKILLVSIYGAMGSKHGVLSSKTCAQITTYAARYYLKLMVRCARWSGCEVIYGDTDSIFCWVKGKDENECMLKGEEIKQSIIESTKGTVFEGVGADVKGNYMSIIISSKKKYEAVHWSGEVETKGLAPVKKDSLPIVKYVMSQILHTLNSGRSKTEMTETLLRLLSKTVVALSRGTLPVKSQVIEKRINNQPHYVYKDSTGNLRTVLVDNSSGIKDVDRRWVVARIKVAVDVILACAGMNSFSEFMFLYNTRANMRAKSDKG